MSDTRNELLLSALRRAGRSIDSDELLDAATGLAIAEGWEPRQICLSRKSVAKRLRDLCASGLVTNDGLGMDTSNRRVTPTYKPVDGFDLRAPVPRAPERDIASAGAVQASTYEGKSRTELLQILEAQDDILESIGRFFVDFQRTSERVRNRLAAAGMEPR